jgi:cell wall-associated NlpC family hydrolase
VQSIFSLHGISLPRDASQQAIAASIDAGRSIDEGEIASLAFFSDREDRRITHVGILLGDGRMAHSGLSRGGFAIENLGDTADEYVATLRRNYVGTGSVTL